MPMNRNHWLRSQRVLSPYLHVAGVLYLLLYVAGLLPKNFWSIISLLWRYCKIQDKFGLVMYSDSDSICYSYSITHALTCPETWMKRIPMTVFTKLEDSSLLTSIKEKYEYLMLTVIRKEYRDTLANNHKRWSLYKTIWQTIITPC